MEESTMKDCKKEAASVGHLSPQKDDSTKQESLIGMVVTSESTPMDGEEWSPPAPAPEHSSTTTMELSSHATTAYSSSDDVAIGRSSRREEVVNNNSSSSSRQEKALDILLTKKSGFLGDPRMRKALAARIADPTISLLQALIIGGFQFQGHVRERMPRNSRPVYDADNVSLAQRKNQLLRRLRSYYSNQQSPKKRQHIEASSSSKRKIDDDNVTTTVKKRRSFASTTASVTAAPTKALSSALVDQETNIPINRAVSSRSMISTNIMPSRKKDGNVKKTVKRRSTAAIREDQDTTSPVSNPEINNNSNPMDMNLMQSLHRQLFNTNTTSSPSLLLSSASANNDPIAAASFLLDCNRRFNSDPTRNTDLQALLSSSRMSHNNSLSNMNSLGSLINNIPPASLTLSEITRRINNLTRDTINNCLQQQERPNQTTGFSQVSDQDILSANLQMGTLLGVSQAPPIGQITEQLLNYISNYTANNRAIRNVNSSNHDRNQIGTQQQDGQLNELLSLINPLSRNVSRVNNNQFQINNHQNRVDTQQQDELLNLQHSLLNRLPMNDLTRFNNNDNQCNQLFQINNHRNQIRTQQQDVELNLLYSLLNHQSSDLRNSGENTPRSQSNR
jgi:hypothetical protein